MGLLEVTDHTFAFNVIERSHTIPVLVDFWAPWCGPCRMLGPVLEKVAPDYAAQVEIVKINTDANPGAPGQYQVSGIPAVKLFKAGKVAAEFVGALPESQVRAFLDQHCPSEFAAALAAAQDLLAQGALAEAEPALAALVAAQPAHPGVALARAELAIRKREFAEAKLRLAEISPRTDEHARAQELGKLLEFMAAGPADAASYQAALTRDGRDHAARYSLAAALLASGASREALAELLAIVEADKRWNNEAARKAMLLIFGSLGVHHPLSDEFRRKLAVLL